MRAPELKSYRLPFIVGEPIWSYAISKIIKSNSPNFKKGEVVYGLLPWEEVTIVTSKMAEVLKVVENKEGLPLSNWVGIAGRYRVCADEAISRSPRLTCAGRYFRQNWDDGIYFILRVCFPSIS